jgi:hypothetical protein
MEIIGGRKFAILERVNWFNHRRLQPIGNISPAEPNEDIRYARPD